ncbi:MAG: DUF5615 family PIN-like protein [Cyanobacteria bacterium SBLK]|nr:DUF5615 family PIN-like protein [Cyanobacteria bacterium SBLK]
MSSRIRFHLDEQVKTVIAKELRRRGIDVTTTVEAKLRMASDDLQFAFICQEKRVLFTQDDDFLKIANSSIDFIIERDTRHRDRYKTNTLYQKMSPTNLKIFGGHIYLSLARKKFKILNKN